MEGWRQVQDSAIPQAPPPEDSQRSGRSPYMRSSMPVNASGNDGLQRQFYDGANAPTYRIFVPGGEA